MFRNKFKRRPDRLKLFNSIYQPNENMRLITKNAVDGSDLKM